MRSRLPRVCKARPAALSWTLRAAHPVPSAPCHPSRRTPPRPGRPPRPREPGIRAGGRGVRPPRRRGPGGGALVVRQRGETLVNLAGGTADGRGQRELDPGHAGDQLLHHQGGRLDRRPPADRSRAALRRRSRRRPLAGSSPPAARTGSPSASSCTHRAGLSSVQSVARRAEDLLDHLAMEERLAARTTAGPDRALGLPRDHLRLARFRTAAPHHRPRPAGARRHRGGRPARDRRPVPRRAGGRPPPRGRAGRLGAAPARRRRPGAGAAAPLATARLPALEALHVDGFHRLFEGEVPPIWAAEMPAVNGVLSAEGLARMYGALAHGGRDGEVRLLSPEDGRRARPGAAAHRRRRARAADALAARLPPRLRHRAARRRRRSVTTATAARAAGPTPTSGCRWGS